MTRILAVSILLASVIAAASTVSLSRGLTAVPGIKVGHATMKERPTGCTVVLVEGGAVAGVDVRGGAPGTREIALLDPVASVQKVHAVVLSGGSAFGLDTASGVMRYLDQRGVGFQTSAGPVPIVPAAVLYDLSVGGGKVRPDADAGYRAAKAASSDPVSEGNVGAGAGATVGKLCGVKRAMKGGLGSYAIRRDDGLVVAALVAVNAVGDVIDPASGEVIAGARTDDGSGLLDMRRLGLSDAACGNPLAGENTTIGVVATNAILTQAQATKLAQMAQDGLARTIYPAHTPWDGDTIFVLATGEWQGDTSLAILGATAAEVVARSVIRAVWSAESLPGLPAANDLLEAEPAAP
jgi:L-aminopeptidase/D-esterase-like protein